MNAAPQANQTPKIDLLDEIQDGIFVLTGESEISIQKLLTDRFIVENTDFGTLSEFFQAARVKSKEDLEKESFEIFIKSHTRFKSWEDMLVESSNQYVLTKSETLDN